GDDHELGAVPGVQLAEDPADVGLDRRPLDTVDRRCRIRCLRPRTGRLTPRHNLSARRDRSDHSSACAVICALNPACPDGLTPMNRPEGMAMRVFRRGLAVATTALLAVAILASPASAATFNVRDFGATGNGSTNDTAAIQRAIDAAARAGGRVVQFPSGAYRSANSIHMRSNVTLQLDSGSTVLGSPNDTYDRAEP